MLNRIRAALNVLAGRPTSYRMTFVGQVELSTDQRSVLVENVIRLS